MSEIIVDNIPDPEVGVRLLEDWYEDVCESDPKESGVGDELRYLGGTVWFGNKVNWGELPIVAGGGDYELPDCGSWDKFYVLSEVITEIVGKMLDGLDDDDGPHGLAIVRRAYRRHC